MSQVFDDYAALLGDVKARIAGSQTRAALAANRELLRLYWEIGRLIDARQAEEGWGAGVIPRLARDLSRELPDARGFSETNLKRMVQYFKAYPALPAAPSAAVSPAQREIGAQVVPQFATGAVEELSFDRAGASTGSSNGIGAQAVPQFPANGVDELDTGSCSLELPWGPSTPCAGWTSPSACRPTS